MADQNEIGIDLRLKTQKLGQDIASAGNQIKSGLATSVKGLGETSVEREERAAAAVARRAAIARRQRNERLDLADEIEAASRRNRARALWRQREQDRQKQQSGGSRIPIQSILAGVGLGIPGVGAIAGLAQLNPAAAVATVALRGLAHVAHETAKAFENARRLYAKTLQSGFGTQMTAKMSTLSSVIGVSENEVWQYGAAISSVSGRLKTATDIIAETNSKLTGVAWAFKIVSVNAQALYSQFASGLSSALGAVADDLNAFMEALEKMKILETLGDLAGAFVIALNDAVGILEIIVSGVVNGFKVIGDSIAIFIMDTLNLLSKIPGLKKIGGWDTGPAKKDMENSSQAVADLAQRVWDNKFGKNDGDAPPPVAFMKQMKASQWERMGLVIGSGGGTNYGQKTAENTKATATLLAKLPTEIAAAFTRYMSHNVNHSIPQIP